MPTRGSGPGVAKSVGCVRATLLVCAPIARARWLGVPKARDKTSAANGRAPVLAGIHPACPSGWRQKAHGFAGHVGRAVAPKKRANHSLAAQTIV